MVNIFLKNLKKEKITALLFYPFPLDSSHFYPDTISSGFDFIKSDSGIKIKISFLPEEDKSFYVYYEQRLNKNIARYILKTTKHWKKPLKLAKFEIELPENLYNWKISYPIDSIKKENKNIKIYLTKRNFFPKEDIIITW